MRRIAYSFVLAQASRLCYGNQSLDDEETARLKALINKRAQEYWESFFWPELTIVEQRTFRPIYDPQVTYAPGTELYWPLQEAYYMTLQPVYNIPPTDDEGNINSAYWALCAGSYNDKDVFDINHQYEPGDQLIYPLNGQVYQCFQAAKGVLPTDTTCFYPLNEFLRNIDYEQQDKTAIGEVRQVWSLNPRIHQEAEIIDKKLTPDGIVVSGTLPNPWIEFRIRPPTWIENIISVTHTSTNNGVVSHLIIPDKNAEGSQVYYNGDFWRATTDVLPTSTPDNDVNNWELVEFPYVLQHAVPQGVFADFLRLDGQTDKSAIEQLEAVRLLHREYDKIERQQGQAGQLRVRTR